MGSVACGGLVYRKRVVCSTHYHHARTVGWSEKARRRKTTGTGRISHLKLVYRRFTNGFREGTQAEPKKAVAAQ